MTRAFQVSWTRSAEEDLKRVTGYIAAEDRPEAALKLLKAIRHKAADLNHSPDRGRVVPELREQGIMLYRELIVSRWRLIYRIAGESVYVLALIDSRRNVEDILLERLTRQG